MSSSNKKLTVVQLDLFRSSTFTSEIERKGGVNLTRHFIENIKTFVKNAFDLVAKNPHEAEEIHSCGGDAYRISFQDVNNAYQFVEKFCQLVKESDDQEPNKDKLIFRIAAATGAISFNPSASGLDRITGDNVLVTVSRLVTANPPGYFYVDEETFTNFNEDIKNKFENESVLVPGKNHEPKIITAYRCQMFIYSNLDISPQPIINQISDIQNADNIVSYLFFIIEPNPNKANKEFFIKAEFVQFVNNKIEGKIKKFYIELSEKQESQSYSDNKIVDVIYNTIEEMNKKLEQENIVLDCSLIIELFVPISLLGIDLNKIPKKYGSNKVPITKDYPLNMRSYERFFQYKINVQSAVSYREKWIHFKRFIDESHNTQEFIETASRNKVSVYYIIKEPVTKLTQRQKIFNEIFRKGFPLCLWTRDEVNQVNNDDLLKIFNIDADNYIDYCKLYKILRNIHDIRENNMEQKTDFGYNLGILFDHDKIPTGANQLISPNMARKV